MKQDISSGYAALRSSAALVPRSTGRLLLRGNDRRSYLHGLLTNDIGALAAGRGCYAAMLTAQGRMITDMRVVELGDAILVDVPRAVTTAIREHLERFVITEDVQIEDVTMTQATVGLYGPRAADVLQSAPTDGDVPGALYASTRVRVAGRDATLISSDEIGVRGFDIVVEHEHAGAVRSALAAAAALAASEEDVEAVRVESGRPLFGVDMDADTIPLEAGLEDRAISRTKGCYVGQEVIVRVLDRGHGRVAKRFGGVTFDAGGEVPARGAIIRTGGKDVGRVTSAVRSPSLSRPIALGYLLRDFVEPGTHVEVGGEPGVVTALPFVK